VEEFEDKHNGADVLNVGS